MQLKNVTLITGKALVKEQQQQQQFIYRFRLYKGLVLQIASKLVEAGQDKKNYSKLQTCWKTENLTLHNNADLDKAIHKN